MDQNKDASQLVRTIIKTDKGEFTFTTEINSDQHKFIFDTGLRYLIATGALSAPVVGLHMEGEDFQQEDAPKEEPKIVLN